MDVIGLSDPLGASDLEIKDIRVDCLSLVSYQSDDNKNFIKNVLKSRGFSLVKKGFNINGIAMH